MKDKLYTASSIREMFSLYNSISFNNTNKKKIALIKYFSEIQKSYNISELCYLLNLNRKTYYNLKNKIDVAQNGHCTDRVVRKTKFSKVEKELVNFIFFASNSLYGRHKIAHLMNLRYGIKIHPDTVGSIMKEKNLYSTYNKYAKCSFRSNNKLSNTSLYSNLLTDFNNLQNSNLHSVYLTSDITYIKIETNIWIYLCTVIDKRTKKVISKKLDNNMSSSLVTATVKEAYTYLMDKSKFYDFEINEIILHSDNGTQYHSKAYMDLAKALHIKLSYVDPYRKCADNASHESFHSILKKELISKYSFTDLTNTIIEIDRYIEFYNYGRPHSSLKYKTPNEAEINFFMRNNKS